jgi:cell division protease FtsH
VLLGGRAAEELIFQHFTTGAGNDLERATDLARKMVCNWGMSDELGPVTFGKRDEHIFLGREISQAKDFSEETARVIDHAIKNLVLNAYNQARNLLAANRAQLEALAQTLLEKETLDSNEIDQILASFQDSKEPSETPEIPAQLPLGLQQA